MNTVGTHEINVWIRESGHKLDAIYITKGTETPTDGSKQKEINPTDCEEEICNNNIDDDGDNDIDCDDGDCDGDPACITGQPKTTEVHVDLMSNQIHIVGDNIEPDMGLVTTLGEFPESLICGIPNSMSLTCALPEGITPGDYRLRVEALDGKYDEYDLTIANDLTDALCALYRANGNPLPGCYEIGELGPAGGIVFYITDGGFHGLAADYEDLSSDSQWGCYESEITGADGTAVGTGEQNTADIIEQGCTGTDSSPSAAEVAYAPGWFLPSKDELNELYLQRAVVGGLSSDYYWSSSEGSSSGAWAQNFTNGVQSSSSKNLTLRVRAVRSF